MYLDDISLVVSSCDIYEDAWYPYFELIKKYWVNHPKEIYLITERKNFVSENIRINVKNYDCVFGKRLYKTLSEIKTKYIIFSLEDFFLQSPVNENVIKKCYEWMEENPNIAVCRFYPSNLDQLIPTQKYEKFYLAGNDIKYRLDTQMAIWNRETLMSFIDINEDPWQFESNGTKRIKNTEKLFLWYYAEDNDLLLSSSLDSNKAFDYSVKDTYGYGIRQGRWLWNNEKLFKLNEIYNVNLKRLGVISERTFFFRKKHLFNKEQNIIEKFIKPVWKRFIKLKKLKSCLQILGVKEGIKYFNSNR